jgi:hypothetical protein
MRGEVLRILTATNVALRDHYTTTLFPQPESQPGPCTAHSTFYAANIAAGMALHQFIRWLRSQRETCDLTFNLLADELIPYETNHERPPNHFEKLSSSVKDRK